MGYFKNKEIEEYDLELAQLLFMWGDVVNVAAVLETMHNKKGSNFKIPKRYLEPTLAIMDFWNKWYGGKNGN